ncbi:unnamed protein product [Gadus morhua 'NCC']
MNSVEKRHSGRRSSGHRKHSDGGYSDSSSAGSFPDETDREVSNLTDRAFRSLCIGDEAVYNDSDLSAASPSGRTERQQAFCQGGRGWKREDAKRAAQERYGLEWLPGAESQGDPGWAGTLDGRTGGRVSETFQHALMDGSLHQRSLNREPVSPLSNGAPEFSTQERRSRSRVSSLIKAFNSDGVRDGGNEGNWDRSALMSIQRDVSEISTAYGQNVNSTPFSPSGPCSSQASFYSSQVATAHLDSSSSSSFMRSSHSQHSVTSLYSSSVPNVFIHSEYSPFRVWRRTHDRYPYQHGDVSGYMDRSGFQTWYETPLYKELSLGPETQRVPMQEQWAAEPPPRKPLEHVALPPAPRSSSTSTVLHTASAVQKRCESELAEFHTMRKRTQSLGNNKPPSQRPSTVSPTTEMRRRGRATTLNSITDLQQKFRTMTSERGVTAEVMGDPHGALPGNDGFIQFANCTSATAVAGAAVVGSNAYPAPFSAGQSHTLGVCAPQEVRASEVNQCALSPPAMEHAPVRAESRGATPDVRLSGYKARATSLLFNLRDNRKSVKSTYSPPKFIGLENCDRNKQVIKKDGMEPRDTVIDIPEFQDSDLPQVVMQQGPSVDPHTPSHPPLTGYHSPGVTAFNPHLPAAYQVQRKDYVSGDYLKPLTQSEMFHHAGVNSYSQDEHTSTPLAHGHVQQQECVPSFANKMHANNMSKTATSVGHQYRQEKDNQSGISNTISMAASPQPDAIYSATEEPRLHVDYTNQTAYQMKTASAKQYLKESTRGDLTHVDRYEQVKDNKYAFSDLSSTDSWTHQCQEKETPYVMDKLNVQLPTEAPPLTENDPNAQFYPEMDMLTDMLLLPPPEYGSSEDWNMSSTKTQDNLEFDESKAEGFPVYPQKDGLHPPYHTSVNPYLSNQTNQVQQYTACSTQSTPGDAAANEKQPSRTLQEYRVHNQQDGIKEIQSTEKYPQIRGTEQEHTKQKSYGADGHDNYMFTQESSQIQKDIEVLETTNKLRDPQDAVKQQCELNLKEKTLTANQMQSMAKPQFSKNQDREIQLVDVKEKAKGKINEKHIQTELSKQLEWAQTLQTKLESFRAGLTEELVTHRATEGPTEPTTEPVLVEGQPHGEETITDKVHVVQSKDVNITEQEDKQVRAHPAEVDQGMKSQRNKDDRSTAELKERSTAEEDEVEVAQKECIETIRISPDGKAKGEVLAGREPGAEQAKEGQEPAGTIPAGVLKMKQSEQVQTVSGAPVEPIKAQLSKTGIEKAKLPKMDETKAVYIKIDDDINVKGKDELLRAEKINADPPKVEKVKDPFRTNPAPAEHAKVKIEKAKEEPNKVVTAEDEPPSTEQGRARMEHAKIEHAKEKREHAKALSEKRMEHSVESLLIRKAEKDKLKQEPGRVEKVKTELAKARAELAEFKEKMKEEQKVKQTNAIVSKEVDKNILQKEKHPPPYQPTEETPVIVLVDEYERVREKYGFSETALANKNLASANDVASPSQDMEMSRPHSAKGEEASGISKPRDAENPQIATEDEAKRPNAKGEEFRENRYVYSETSKEFKLTSPYDSSSSLVTQQMDREIGVVKNTKDKVLNTKPGPVSANIDVSQPGGSNINPTKSHMNMNTHERQLNPNKYSHSTPSRTLSHKERTQTKQEILTSKIKAHAEKEISAIKEKHFASGKSVQQRLPSQEVTKPLDKNIPHSIAPREKHATAPLKTSIPDSETTPPVMPSNATQKQEPLKRVQDTVVPQPMALKETKNINNRNEELKAREKKSATKATSQIKEENPISLGKEEVMNVNVIHQAAEDVTTPQKTKAHPPPSKPEESPQNETPQSSDAAIGETLQRPEGAPMVKLGFGQDEAPANDDSLQIMGIMVTVRAKAETVGTNDEDGGAIKEAREKAKIDSEINDDIKPPGILCLETTKENIAQDVSNGRAEEQKQFVHASQPTVGMQYTKVGAKNHPENEPGETTDHLENKMADLTYKRLTAQKESSLMRKTSHSHAVHRGDPVADKENSSTSMKPAPNKPGKTQPILFKQGKITEKAKIYTNKNSSEVKSNVKGNVEVGNDPSLAKAMEIGFDSQTSSLKSDIKSSKMQSHPASEKYKMADPIPLTKTDKVQDGGTVPLLVDERTHPSLPEAEPQNKNSTSPELKGPENVHISIGQQGARTPSEENHQEDGNVHIGCIAVRVVQGVIVQDDKEKAGKEVVAIQSLAETMNTERNRDGALPLTPAIKPSAENVVHQVQHMGSTNQSRKVTDSSEAKRDEDEQSKMASAKAVGESNTTVQATEEEYFQFQGVTERSQEPDDAMLDSTGVPGLPKEHTEELSETRTSTSGDVTGLQSDKTSVKTEPSSQPKAEQVTNEDKVLDNTSKTTMESDSAASENMSQSDKSGQDTKNSRLFPERQSNQRLHNTETGQDVPILKQATQNTFHASGKEKQSVRDSHSTRNNRVSASKDQPYDKQEAKSKPRASTIPEISAIADYARLKVIAAEDEPDTIQEFPPNKKEGFFPMIQSRHSRRPVFTAETPERKTVSKKTVLREPEPSLKVEKEPKHLVFSTMEQDHKRTGMFKLREKENVLSDVKTKDKADDDKMRTQDPTGTPQAGSEDFQYWSRDTAKPAGPTLSSSANINQTNTSLSQHSAQPDNSTTTERPQGGEVFTEPRTGPQVDHNSHQQAMFGKMFNKGKNRGDRSNAIVSEAKSKENEEAMAAKQRQENKIIQQINEERRATLETQKREARRAREREARAARIEEDRRETQREAERMAEEERRETQREAERMAEEERRETQREAERMAEEERRETQREAERMAEEERRETQREAERVAEEERRETQREADRVADEERMAQLLKEKAAQEEMEKKREEETRVVEEEGRKKRREEERRKKETEERIAAQIQEEMRRAKQREEERRALEEEARVAKEVEDKRRDRRREEDRRVAQIQEERRASQVEEQRREREEQRREREEQRREREEERREREEEMARAEEERRAKHREIEQRIKEHEERRAAKLEEDRMNRKQEEAHRQQERRGETREEGELPAPMEEREGQQVGTEGAPPSPRMEARRAAPLMDALQYYAISSSANSKEKQPLSPVSPRRRGEPTKQGSTPDESLSSPPAPSSPAPVPPRSTASSPAPGPKPTMFRVKDNTLRASSLTKSVKPRLHKSFGEDFRVGSPLAERRGPDRAEEERDGARRSAGTPVHQDTVSRSYRPPSVKESMAPPSEPEPRAARADHRPYSRRSTAPDEDDSRSCVSNVSEDVESFATSVGDMSDFRGFCDYDRPESACSFSSDVSRSLGKPPSVPPKSDKALRRALRLTTRRMKKGLMKTPEEAPAPEEDPLRSARSSSSSASELRSSYHHARASPHFSAPFSLPHAPPPASSTPSSYAETPAAYRYSHASPHATGSISTPHAAGSISTPHAAGSNSTPHAAGSISTPHAAGSISTPHAAGPVHSPHATLPVSTPFASAHTSAATPHVSAPAYPPVASPRRAPAAPPPAAPKPMASTPSSPVLRRRAVVTPVRQYHVEPGYAPSYPLTQPKVLQDPGSGQYYVVEMPVEVQTKTFFDPETGKYVQLNVRQSARGGFQAPAQHAAYQQPRIAQPQMHVQALPQAYPQVATPGKSFVVYPGYPPGRQAVPVSTLPPQRSYSGMSLPETLPPPGQSARGGQNDSYHGYNAEETPYMDTAYETDTICDTNKVHRGGYEKQPETRTDSRLQGGSVSYENDTIPARSSQEQRDIIAMSELEDFMDVSDW